MNGEGIFFLGERGLHLLFESATITAAFGEDPGALCEVVVEHRHELESVLGQILGIDDAALARRFIEELPRELRHVLVHLYFEILEGRLRRRGRALH